MRRQIATIDLFDYSLTLVSLNIRLMSPHNRLRSASSNLTYESEYTGYV